MMKAVSIEKAKLEERMRWQMSLFRVGEDPTPVRAIPLTKVLLKY